jgi:phosphoribosylanthranilate isomerase
MVRVKICGITTVEDALAAIKSGADALGFVFAPSPRQVSPERVRSIIRELPPLVTKVGVFVDAGLEEIRHLKAFCKLDLVQLHGAETEHCAEQLGSGVIKAIAVGIERICQEQAYPSTTLLLDTYSPSGAGGTGKSFDWLLAVSVAKRRPIILAGGLTPENVVEAINTVSPYAVDVSSGVEHAPGRKNHEKMSSFVRRAKSANHHS